jgi:hypothetical protein
MNLRAFGTAQIPDILIYNGDTLSLFDCPLAYFPDQGLFSPLRPFGSSGCFYTACYRNYVATWKIESNKLYLLSIRNACYPTDMNYVNITNKDGAKILGSEFADLQSIFQNRYADGRVLADWVNTKLISPKGKMLYYIHDGFLSIFEKELEFTIENGILVQVKEYDNSKTRASNYTKNPDLILEFIKNNIDYSNLPKTDSTVKVIVGVLDANEEGEIDKIRIFRGFNEAYDKEAERVVKSIPEWDVLYRHGEKIPSPAWIIPVIFRSKN